MDFRDLVSTQKIPMLEKSSYGHWKMKMRTVIRSIGEEAWAAVEEGWAEPTARGDDGSQVPKHRSLWTDLEKEKSKYNSRALSAIFNAVTENQFEIIQCCTSAKDAWDRLESAYEGTKNVKTTRLDMLASKFESLRMEESETIEEFSSKLSSIASEAQTMGKKYKDKKLVKKLLRSLPSRFESKKTAMGTALDTDNMSFVTAVGHLQAYEMELRNSVGSGQMAFISEEDKRMQQMEEQLALITKNFKNWRKVDRRTEEGSKKERGRREEPKCFECHGYGHFRSTCATIKMREAKCSTCKGIGHMSDTCSNNQGQQSSYIGCSDSSSDEEETGFVAFPTTIGDSDSDSDEETAKSVITKSLCCNMSTEELYESWIKLGYENVDLYKRKIQLEERIAALEKIVKEKKEENDRKDEENKRKIEAELTIQNRKLSEAIKEEQQKSIKLQAELSEAYQRVRTLNNGTVKLNKILSEGRPSGSYHGIGYDGIENTPRTEFVASTISHADEMKGRTTHEEGSSSRSGRNYDQRRKNKSCYHCGKYGHKRRRCNAFKRWVQTLIQQGHGYQNRGRKNQVWIAKVKLYRKAGSTMLKPKGVQEQIVAFMAGRKFSRKRWYFDSGASRHMTGNQELLDDYSEIEESTVTFGGGASGMIKGKGRLAAPELKNVFYVQGLKVNLISVSQLSDEGCTVSFNGKSCTVRDNNNQVVMTGARAGNNCYMWEPMETCYRAVKDDTILWHQKLGHMNIRSMSRLSTHELVRGLPEIKNLENFVCGGCKKGKQIKVQHKKVPDVQTKEVAEIIHMDLMGPMQVESIAGKRYVFVLVDDFSRYTWVRFLRDKSETLESFKILCLQLKNQTKGIKQIRSDHGGEFQNQLFDRFCNQQGIMHQFSAPRTPQQNGVVERKNRTLQEMARAMIHSSQVPEKFWAEAINTACYIINRVYLTKETMKTPYEIWKGKKPTLSYFHVFGCKCYILNDKDQLGKFDSRSDEGFFLGYSTNSTAYRVFNKRSRMIMESVNVVFDDESVQPVITVPTNEEEKTQEESVITDEVSVTTEVETEEPEVTNIQVHRNHSASDLIGGLNEGRKTRGVSLNFREMVMFACFVSLTEPSNPSEAMQDPQWIQAMQEELEEFERNQVWSLVPRPADTNIIGTKWIFRNKNDDEGIVIRNKARLAAQGYTQLEGIDFEEPLHQWHVWSQ